MKAIIFDFDGVVFDSEPMHWRACNKVFAEMGFQLSYEDYLQKYIGITDKEMFPLVLQDYQQIFDENKIQDYLLKKIHAYENIIQSSTSLDSVGRLDNFLKLTAKFINKFAICSGSTRRELQSALHKLEQGSIQSYFNFVVTSEDVQEGKPSPEGYLKTAHYLQVEPHDCVVIEDTHKGILAAKAANMRVIGMATTHDKHELIAMGAEFAATSYTDIYRYLFE